MSDTGGSYPYLEAAPDAILLVDERGVITYANRIAAEIFGHDQHHLVGLAVNDLVPERHRQQHRAHLTRYRADPRTRPMGTEEATVTGVRADGTEFAAEISLSPVTNSEPAPQTMAVVRDITQRQLRTSETFTIRQSLDVVDDAVYIFDDQTLEFRYVNRGAVSQTGYTRQELLAGMTPLSIKPEFTAAEFEALIEPLRSGREETTTFSTVHRHKDGSDVPVEVSLQHPAEAQIGGRPCFVALARDVSQRRENEERLRESEIAFRSAFDDAPVGMVMTSGVEPDRRIIRANHMVGAILGREPDELIGIPAGELFRDDGGAERVELQHADGHSVWCLVHTSEVVGSAAQRRLIHLLDISERVAAEAARDRRERLLAALGDVRMHLLADHPLADVLGEICAAVAELVADSECLISLDSGGGEMEVVAGTGRAVVGETFAPGAETPFTDGSTAEVRFPLSTRSGTEGELVVARRTGGTDREDEGILAALASEAAIAVQHARSRRDRRRLLVLEDRERIARDLHDVVIQRLFAAGMRLQAAAGSSMELRRRAIETVSELDETIADIRETIFRLTSMETDVQADVQLIVDGYRSPGGRPIDLRLKGDLSDIPDDVAEHLFPTLNELLSNASRHSEAGAVAVSIEVADEVVLEVTDDGVGFADAMGRGNGLDNIAARAASLGGEMEVNSGAEQGTSVRWRIPVRQ